LAALLSFKYFTLYRIVFRALLILFYPLLLADRVLMRYGRIPSRIYTNCVVYARKM